MGDFDTVKTQKILDLCYPGWTEEHGDDWPPICIPVCLDLLKSYVASRNKNADGYNNAIKDTFQSRIDGDDSELIFYNKIRSLNIGGIVIANFQLKLFQKTMKLKQDKHETDFEIDFILLHPQFGIYAVEVKASPKIDKPNNNKYRDAVKQLSTFSIWIRTFYEAMTGKQMEADAFCGVGLFAPKSDLTFPRGESIEHICPQFGGNNEDFSTFWKDKINSSVSQHGKRNLFSDTHQDFRKFLLILIGYNTDTQIRSEKFSLDLAKRLMKQQIDPFPNTASKTQNESEKYTISLDGKKPQPIFLTPIQKLALESTDDLQLIYGVPGTGKTIILLLKALKAAREKKRGRVMITTWEDFEPKVMKIFEAHKSELNREIVFGRTPKKDDDLFRDEMGPNALSFLLWRAKKHQNGKTVAVFTGNINAGDYASELENIRRILSTAQRSYKTHTLDTLMRNTKNITSFWIKELDFKGTEDESETSFENKDKSELPVVVNGQSEPPVEDSGTLKEQNKFPFGHDFDGVPVVHKLFPLVSLVLEEVATTLHNLLGHSVSRQSIAIIGPRKKEVDQMRIYLEREFKSKDLFGSVKEYRENAIILDEHSTVLSNEWIFVIAFSLGCKDLYETFHVTASSRAISSLFFYERDYIEIQKGIDQQFDRNKPYKLDHKAIKKMLFHAIERIGTDLEEENDFQAINFHRCLTVLRKNYITKTFIPSFPGCHTFSQWLQYALSAEHIFRAFVGDMHETKRMLGKIVSRMKGKNYQKPEVHLLQHFKFFNRSLGVSDESELGKIYLNFCRRWGDTILVLYYESMQNKVHWRRQVPALDDLRNDPVWNLVVNAGNLLVKNRCSARFLPI